MSSSIKDGLNYILQAINNMIEPKLEKLRYDKTYRAKITKKIDVGVYNVQINGTEYKLSYNGDLKEGDIVKVKAPLNNFSDIYVESLPGSGGSSTPTDYNNLTNKPILNTNNGTAQDVNSSEILKGTIKLHKISKTGNYNDLNNKPSLNFIPTSEKGAANGVPKLDSDSKIPPVNLPIASKTSLGCFKLGQNLILTEDGTLSATGGGAGVVIVDNLNSTSASDVLSANQGRVLNNKHTAINAQLSGDVTSGESKIDSNNKISITATRKGCFVGQSSNTTTKPWYKFASCTVDADYSDRDIIFNVYQGYGDNSQKVGILIAHFRTKASHIWESGQLKWLVKATDMPAADFVLAHNTAAPCIVELWCKCSYPYGGYHFDVISEGTRNTRGNYWTLYNTVSAGSQDAITSGYTQITSVVNKISMQVDTRNTTDTYIPVLKSGELQYTTRVIVNSKTSTNYNTEQDRIPTLSFLSYWNGAYSTDNYSNLTYAHQGIIQCKPKSLYDNNSGTTGTITLSETAANFTYLEIFYFYPHWDGYLYGSTKIYSPNGKLSTLGTELQYRDDVGTMFLKWMRILISGTSLSVKAAGSAYYGNTSGTDTTGGLKIYKVIGYK